MLHGVLWMVGSGIQRIGEAALPPSVERSASGCMIRAIDDEESTMSRLGFRLTACVVAGVAVAVLHAQDGAVF